VSVLERIYANRANFFPDWRFFSFSGVVYIKVKENEILFRKSLNVFAIWKKLPYRKGRGREGNDAQAVAKRRPDWQTALSTDLSQNSKLVSLP
jgi:hypothetical protein